MKRNQRKDAESGQAIVLIALFMVVLMGFTGLAIDGGGLFFMNRDAQNATDAAVLAAAYAKCMNGDITTAALAAARENGFDNNGDSNVVIVREEGNVLDIPSGMSSNGLVQVEIQADKPSFFIQIVYPGPLSVQARATAYCDQGRNTSNLVGFLATGECNDGISLTGNGMTFTGSAHSNGEVKIQPGGAQMKFGDGSSVSGSFNPPAQYNNNVDWSNITEPTSPSPMVASPGENVLGLDPAMYGPGGEVYEMVKAKGGKVHHYPSGLKNPDGVLEGLYYVKGDVQINNKATVSPNGVTIVSDGGKIQFSPKDVGSGAKFYPMIMDVTPSGVRYPGIMLYTSSVGSECGKNNGIKFNGPSNKILGILYAPYADANWSASSNTFQGMLIAQTIDFSGANAKIMTDPSLVPPQPPMVYYTQ